LLFKHVVVSIPVFISILQIAHRSRKVLIERRMDRMIMRVNFHHDIPFNMPGAVHECKRRTRHIQTANQGSFNKRRHDPQREKERKKESELPHTIIKSSEKLHAFHHNPITHTPSLHSSIQLSPRQIQNFNTTGSPNRPLPCSLRRRAGAHAAAVAGQIQCFGLFVCGGAPGPWERGAEEDGFRLGLRFRLGAGV